MQSDVAAKIQQFFERYPEREFYKQQIIVQAGEQPDGIYYLVEGRVNQYDISPRGSEVVVNIFKPPAFFPVSWAVNKVPNRYFFEAGTDVVARVAPAEDVVEFLKSEPDVLFDLLSRVYKGTDGLLRRMAHLMGGDARSRLLFEVLNVAYRFGIPDKTGAVLVPLKEGELAKHTGLARETVSRGVQNLKAIGLLEVTKTGLVLPDIKKLEAELGADL